MTQSRTFGQKVGAGFAVIVGLSLLIAGVSIYTLRTVVASKDRVISVNAQALIDAERLRVVSERKGMSTRGFLLTGEGRFLDDLGKIRADFDSRVDRMKADVSTEEERQLLAQIERAEADHNAVTDEAVARRKASAVLESVARFFDERVSPKREVLDQRIGAFVSYEQRLLGDTTRASTDAASSATTFVVITAVIAVLFAGVVGVALTRSLARQIGSAVQHVQSSSAELQTAASQQATGAKEQATAMTEISTTISELLATSRQIAESAQRVAQIAEETAAGARGGEATVQKAQASISGIKHQVDAIVTHMLDLGKKSQQIGSILEIINELAEQTNILAINATIEAAGAGEAGARFGVVADEIRKLADRVGGSAMEIRGLIEDVRAAVNATVMATEGGSKTADAGTRQFGEVAASFAQITRLVGTTTEAAREIELSTKQQATAVEQVKVAIANVTQATKETEASSTQTVQTASLLTTLSRDLGRLIQPHPIA